MIYEFIYNKILTETKSRTRFIGCHKHRIIPGYVGGTYSPENILFLTQREHRIIHFLRWKIFKDNRDKKSFKMIGVGVSGLSHKDRIDHGKDCATRKIGFHGAHDKDKNIWRANGRNKQKALFLEKGDKNWFYWSTPKGRSERAKMGGLKSSKTNQAFIKQQSSFKDSERASKASKLSAKKPATNGTNTKKFHTDEKRSLFLLENPTWRIGCHWKKNSKLEKLKLVN